MNRKPRDKCKNCGKDVKRKPNIYCSNRCQQDHQYKEFIKRWLEGKEKGTKGKIKLVSNHIKRWLRETRGNECEKCHWNEIHQVTHTVPVEVNHIDGNADNVVPNNLELLCPNCHSLTPNYRSLNKNSSRIR